MPSVWSKKEIEPNPYQPRSTFDKDKLDELAESIKKLYHH